MTKAELQQTKQLLQRVSNEHLQATFSHEKQRDIINDAIVIIDSISKNAD